MENHVQSVSASAKPADQLSYHDLLDVIVQERGWDPQEVSARAFKSHVKAWCDYLGVDLFSLAIETLPLQAQGGLSALTELLSKGDGPTPRKASNVRWAVTELYRVYESLRVTSSLPSGYRAALLAAMEGKGWKVEDLVRALEAYQGPGVKAGTVRSHVRGTRTPDYRNKVSAHLIEAIEKVLGLAAGTLTSRAFKGPSLIKVAVQAPNRYREFQSLRTKAPYAVKKLPPQLASVWEELTRWRAQPHHRVRGQVYVHTPQTVWSRPGTAEKYHANVCRYIGWLCLPTTPSQLEASSEKGWRTGKGMRPEDISVAHLLDLDLVWEFLEFLRARQHNKVFTQDTLHYVVFLNSLVNSDYSYIKAHDKLAPFFGQNLRGQAWVDWVEEHLHKPVLALSRSLKKGMPAQRQRHPDEALRGVYEDKDPLLLFWEMVERLEENLAPSTQKNRHAAELRDIALFRIALEVPLRATNLCHLRIGKTICFDESSGLWSVQLPKEELKNHSSSHAQDIYRQYSPEASAALTRYVKLARPVLRGADLVDWLFLTTASGPKRSDEQDCPYRMLEQSVYTQVRKRTEDYFGSGTGANVFRHVLATAILKEDPSQVETASAVLNNSPDTVRANYKHLTQKDGLRRADEWREGQKAKLEARFGRRPGAGT